MSRINAETLPAAAGALLFVLAYLTSAIAPILSQARCKDESARWYLWRSEPSAKKLRTAFGVPNFFMASAAESNLTH